uniref:Galactose-3-O-sulfotransferase 2-like n=1 Tax=Branchiostoma floridae TaxID=7739 RepID=C3Y9B6_BRAFL|eukprot:XP_002607162.1 hypothetical protein BRAFLDRAFT_68043 [Branchiostoma floridae]
MELTLKLLSVVMVTSLVFLYTARAQSLPDFPVTTEVEELQSEVDALAQDLPMTLEELGLTSVVHHVQELKTDAVERSRHNCYYHDCHCGTEEDFNGLGERLCDGECNSRCRGNSTQKCGDWYKMSVYKIDAVPSCESGSRQVSPHWYRTGTTTSLQYRGDPDSRPFAFATPEFEENTDNAIPIQDTLVNLEEDIEGFPDHYPATTAEGMPNLVSDYRALLASLQDTDIQESFTPGTNTTLKLDQHFTIKSYPCSLEYSPTEGRGKRAVTKEDYVHTPYEQYDVLLNHMVYNKTWLRNKFPAETVYISIIREPSSHLRSAMNYYHLPELLKIKSKNPVQTFLQDPWKYKDLSEAYFDFCNVTWDGTRNFLSFDLGYPTEGAEDKERARRYISELEADFTLVLLLEHLDESLVLLRRLMCWEVRDVLYDVEGKNNRIYPYKSYIPTAEELANLRRWKAVDYLVYDTFNASLWRKIAAQGPDFYEELHYFREVRKSVSKFCHTLKRHQQPLIIKASKWSPQFAVNSMYCRGLQTRLRPARSSSCPHGPAPARTDSSSGPHVPAPAHTVQLRPARSSSGPHSPFFTKKLAKKV